MPACNGEYPCTSCQYWVISSSEPNIAKKSIVMVPLPALKRALRNTVRSSIGCDVWRSQSRNEVSSSNFVPVIAAGEQQHLPQDHHGHERSTVVLFAAVLKEGDKELLQLAANVWNSSRVVA